MNKGNHGDDYRGMEDVMTLPARDHKPAGQPDAGIAASVEDVPLHPPAESGDFLPTELVDLAVADPRLVLDIRYATNNNFTGQKVYTEARAFLQRAAISALIRAHDRLRAQGLGLVIFDGYRPWSVTRMFWILTPLEQREFVADPRNGSRHNRGCSLDVTLIDLSTGRYLEMPTEFDEFTSRAYHSYDVCSAESARNRSILREAMESEGFGINPSEWWHYDYPDWARYQILDLSFAELG